MEVSHSVHNEFLFYSFCSLSVRTTCCLCIRCRRALQPPSNKRTVYKHCKNLTYKYSTMYYWNYFLTNLYISANFMNTFVWNNASMQYFKKKIHRNVQICPSDSPIALVRRKKKTREGEFNTFRKEYIIHVWGNITHIGGNVTHVGGNTADVAGLEHMSEGI